ncbi:winged helix-turn-helix transcriptional regulator [Phycicoccus flavus]|uniref:winged helix-turn-helix transcriptional regulator n=1 Tax=Phycicoccus flavus TaxID=2502783 RepID=UPI000FEBC0A3|nr:helix-turn-helix domain-containing protein [Phycicoccus flavus]NHA69045.1 helix-turn-helix transcriptional regulator [Phycicoccus flavus]
MVGKRNYDQLCGLALSLDVVGERWTLLVLRELLLGPARFKDILAGLPRLTPTLLSARLQGLADAGIVRAEPVPHDARGRQYVLTELGEGLREPVLGLARWGLGLVTDEDAERMPAQAGWARLAVEAMVQGRSLPAEVSEAYTFAVDGSVFHVDVARGVPSVGDGPAADSALTIKTDATTFVRVGAGLLTPVSAMLERRLRAEGSGDAFARCAAVLGLELVPDAAGPVPSLAATS